jgi:hypothetical protein
MTDLVLVDNFKTIGSDTIEVVYTATNATLITAFTASNSSAASSYFNAYIVNAAGVVGDPVQPQTIVVKDKKNAGSGVVNQLIPAGGTLRVSDQNAGYLNFYVTGRTDT